ncbi:MAG: PSD1 and planctomycete cytochrome C domain-containing protein [Planctomycetaceae bacterium]
MRTSSVTRLTTFGSLWLVLGIPFACPLLAAAPESDAEGVEFFEKQIRPIFVDHCYRCHSQQAEKLKGDLLLDTREGVRKGGDSGPAIVPGDPDASLLVTAVRHSDEGLRMPPGKKLSAGQIADLEAWVRMGAPQPEGAKSGPGKMEARAAAARNHWAFQPIKRPDIPVVEDQGWVETPVDAFILAALESRGMQPSPPADKRTLIRRATYDLIGLPPTLEEVAAFLADDSPGAFSQVVNRLLDSPRYGERWGRHWLDVARYANASQFAFTYRDYVIRAFNDDLPYDRFILEQIAADQLEPGKDKRALAALGFLTVGRRFMDNIHDTIDDRIDVITRGLMGLTVTCARCHDHKYDPIPTEDYYSLYGVFSSSTEPDELPVLEVTSEPSRHAEYLTKRDPLEKKLNEILAEKIAEAQREHRMQSGEYLLMAWQLRNQPTPDPETMLVGEQGLHMGSAARWKAALEKWQQAPHSIFAPWFAFGVLPEEEFVTAAESVAASIVANADAEHPVNPLVAQAVAGTPPTSLKEVSERYGRLFQDVEKRWEEMLEAHAQLTVPEGDAKPEPPTALPDSHGEALRQVLYGEDAPGNLPATLARKQFGPKARMQLQQLRSEVQKLDGGHPDSPPRAMVLADSPTPANSRVFIRGNPSNLGQEAPRQFLGILVGADRKPFQKGSGRLELAQAIASRDNPLTSRLLVNRAWMHHFGAGLVSPSGDFGLRSEPPTHPELLDYLAWRFMEEGWSVKKLHRLVMLSSVYQQQSDNDHRYRKQDPENRLLSKMNRRRLDFEAMRDTLLAVAGNLDSASGGRPVQLIPPAAGRNRRGAKAQREPSANKPQFSTRRSIYGAVDRESLPNLFRMFDFADPDTSTAQRTETTVPQQALFFLNSAFVREQVRTLLAHSELIQQKSAAPRIRRLYQIVYQRNPQPEEIEMGLDFIIEAQSALIAEQAAAESGAATAGPKADDGPAAEGAAAAEGETPTRVEQLTPWEQFAQILLMSNELMFVD